MRTTYLLYALFALAAGALLYAPGDLEPDGSRPQPVAEEAKTDTRAADLVYRARRLASADVALAGSEHAFAALAARLGELEAEAGNAEDLRARLRALVRDFAVRESMVVAAERARGEGMREWRAACDALLREGDDGVRDALEAAKAQLPAGGATQTAAMAASARKEFDTRVAALRQRLRK